MATGAGDFTSMSLYQAKSARLHLAIPARSFGIDRYERVVGYSHLTNR